MMQYLINVLVTISQVTNVLFLKGEPDQTISSRAHVAHKRGASRARNAINFVFFFQEDHCRTSWERDVENAKRFLKIRSEIND